MENSRSEPRRSCETIGNPQWRPVSFFHAADLRDSALVIRPRPPAMSRNFHEYARLVMRTFPLPVTPAILPRQKPPSLFPMTVRFLELRISHESACPVVSVVHVCVWVWSIGCERQCFSDTRPRKPTVLSSSSSSFLDHTAIK